MARTTDDRIGEILESLQLSVIETARMGRDAPNKVKRQFVRALIDDMLKAGAKLETIYGQLK